MAKPLNFERRMRAIETATPKKAPNPVAKALALRGGQGRHTDRKKQGARRACRGRVSAEG